MHSGAGELSEQIPCYKDIGNDLLQLTMVHGETIEMNLLYLVCGSIYSMCVELWWAKLDDISKFP